MLLSCFVVDNDQQLRRVSPEQAEAVWHGREQPACLPLELNDQLRMITVLSDEDLEPRVCFFLRLDLDEGEITEESRQEAFEATGTRDKRRYDTQAARRQFQGWPKNWRNQLAVALDFPAEGLRKVGLGGPMVMADLWGVPIEKVLEFFEQAIDD